MTPEEAQRIEVMWEGGIGYVPHARQIVDLAHTVAGMHYEYAAQKFDQGKWCWLDGVTLWAEDDFLPEHLRENVWSTDITEAYELAADNYRSLPTRYVCRMVSNPEVVE